MTCKPNAIGSAGGAAEYYAADNYYAGGEQGPSEWGGKGASDLELSGPVEVGKFEQVLDGKLPNGAVIAPGADGRNPGMDLTFSAPKSVSLVALVGGDMRVLEAHARAVRSVMGWAEERFATTRMGAGGQEKVATGKLLYAMFHHDLSRALDPQIHTHVVIANATRTTDGKWKAYDSLPLWKQSALFGAAYHAELRAELTKLGYRTEITDPTKHGQFEIVGLPRDVVEAFSIRALQIRAKAAELGITSQRGLGAVAERTRDAKGVGDADTARALWAEKALVHGTAIGAVVDAARAAHRPRSLLDTVRGWGENLLSRVTHAFGPKPEPMMTGADKLARGAPLADAYSVAAGVRHLTERAASFEPRDLLKASLGMAEHGATVRGIEARIDQLVATRTLIQARDATAQGRPGEWLTTRDVVATEKAIVAAAADARGRAAPVMGADAARDALAAAAEARGFKLADEQLRAGTAVLAGTDRVQLIQGDAGSGKSTLFLFLREIVEGRGGQVLGLVPQNKLKEELAPTGLELRTVESVLIRHGQVAGRADHQAIDRAVKDLGGKILLVDEASMISNRQMDGLLKIAERAGVAKLLFVGDEKQISPVEAGRPFALLIASGAPTERLTENRRQRPGDLRAAVEAAKVGDMGRVFDILGERVRESADPHKAAAKQYLAMSPAERDRTAIFTSGHVLRQQVLDEVRSGLAKRGVLGAEVMTLPVYQNLNLTQEQMRKLGSYAEGQLLDVHHQLGSLLRGSYEVTLVDASTGRVHIERDGREQSFAPSSLHPQAKGLALSEPARIEVRAGDRLIWTANDEKRGMVNGAPVQVAALDGDALLLRDGKGREHRVEPDDPARQRLDHGAVLNMHRAQGMTVDGAITVMHSGDRLLNSQSLAYVLTSRARDDLTLHTDSKGRLAERVDRHPGAVPHALDLAAQRADARAQATASPTDKQAAAKPFQLDKALRHLSLALGRVGREHEIDAVQRYAWALRDMRDAEILGPGISSMAEKKLDELAVAVDHIRPHAAEDLRSGLERNEDVMRNAAKGRTESAFRLMAEEARVRQSPELQQRRFVADWREVSKGLTTAESGPGRDRLEERQAGLVDRMLGDSGLKRALDRHVPNHREQTAEPGLARIRDREMDMDMGL